MITHDHSWELVFSLLEAQYFFPILGTESQSLAVHAGVSQCFTLWQQLILLIALLLTEEF